MMVRGRLDIRHLMRGKMYGNVHRCHLTFDVVFHEPKRGRGTRGQVLMVSHRLMYDAVVAFVVGYIFADCWRLCGVE